MFEFKNGLNIKDYLNSIFARKNYFRIFNEFYKYESWNFPKFTLKLTVISEEILNLAILLVAANLNR